MKKLFLNFATALLCCTVMLSILTSCVNEDNPTTTPVPDSSQLADVTIMYYAHGGGTLDKHVIGNLRKMYNAERSSYNNVRIAAECKFSNKDYLPSTDDDLFKTVLEADLNKYGEEAEEKLDNITYLLWMAPEANSTFRIAIDPTKTLKEQVKDHYLPGKNCDFTTPDSLTNFINWAAKNCPAKRYILILHDHGGGYRPEADLYKENAKTGSTRGVIFDNGNPGHHFSAPSLAHAIKAADIRPDVVIFDACMMNTLEYLFELKDLTDYIVASTFNSYAGPPYDTFIECISAASDNLKYALEKYIEYDAKHFDELSKMDHMDIFYNDITVTETARLNVLGKVMREFTDRLCDTYTNGTEQQKQLIDNCTKQAVKIDATQPSYDATKYMASIMNALPEVYDDDFVQKMADTINSCILAQNFSSYLINHNYIVDYSVLLGVEGSLAPWNSTFDDTYGQLEFDRLVGWSRWIKLNF